MTTFNIVSLPVHDPAPEVSITPTDSPSYNSALLAALDIAGPDKLVPLDARAVAALAPYNPLQAWALYRDGQKIALMAIQSAPKEQS